MEDRQKKAEGTRPVLAQSTRYPCFFILGEAQPADNPRGLPVIRNIYAPPSEVEVKKLP